MIQLVQELKYLGVKLWKSLSFSSHVTYVLENAGFARKRLWRLLNPRNSLHVENRILLFVLFIHSIDHDLQCSSLELFE